MSALIHPVILCGGGGTRLWPRSRPDRPKPFLQLLGQRTLFQQTLDRVGDPARFAAPMVVAGEAHLPLIREQGGAGMSVVAEPAGRNTAPAIALAAHRLPPEALMLVCPSDHHIGDTPAFIEAALAAAGLARDGWLVSLGIAADRPETGYGYIKRGHALAGGFAVERFVEKPDLATAAGFIADGSYSWNGGIFVFTAGRFLEELATHRPAMASAVADAANQGHDRDGVFRPGSDGFAAIDAESIDYAVMEPTERKAMVPVAMGWSDIGNWQALADARGDQSRGRLDVLDAENVLIDSDGPRVSVVGLSDIIVVVDGEEVLVMSRDAAQHVGKLPGALGR